MPTRWTHLPTWVGPAACGMAYAAVWLAATHRLTALAHRLSRRSARVFQTLGAWKLGDVSSAFGAAAALDGALIYSAFAPGTCQPISCFTRPA